MELRHSCHVAAKYFPIIGNSLGNVLQLGRTIPLIPDFRKVDFCAGAEFKSTELWLLGSKFDFFWPVFLYCVTFLQLIVLILFYLFLFWFVRL